MKVKLVIPEEIEIGKNFTARVEEIVETEEALLLQAHNEPEVFVILKNVKHWLQNPETALALNYDIYKRKMVTLEQLNEYPTGDTFKKIGEPKRARDIYYPSTEPVCKAWRPDRRGIISIGTGEGSMPSVENTKKLCNIWLPFKTYSSFMEQIGKTGIEAIFMHTKRDENRFNVAGYLAVEEPLSKPSGKPIGEPDDGKVTDSNTIWGRINTFRRKTNKPIGILDNDVHFRVWSKECKRHLEIYKAVDFLMSELYPYHTQVEDPIERMENSYKWIAEFSEKYDKPFIVIAQATYGEANGKLNLPDLQEQHDFWCKEKGLGIIWWKWQGSSGQSIKEEFQDEIKRLHKL